MASKSSFTDYILTNPIPKVMWKLAIPAMSTMIIFGLNNLIDAIFVGQLIGGKALSGIALAGAITGLMVAAGYWIGSGAANVLSNALGAKDTDVQRKLLGTSGLLVLIMSNIFAVPFYFLSEYLIGFMGGRGEVLNLGAEYMEVTAIGTTFWVFGLVFNMLVRGEGKIKKAAVMTSYGLIVNLILNPIFIIKLEMGVSGAALATNLGMLVYCIVGFFYFIRGKASFENDVKYLQFDKDIALRIIKTGMPSFILAAMGMIQSFVIFNAIVDVGTDDDLAFFAAANRVLMFLVTPLMGLMRAFQPMAGINFGARQFERVKECFLQFTLHGVIIIMPFWVLMTFFPSYTLHLILPDMEFYAIDLWYFQVGIMMLPVLPMVYISLTLFPATGNSQIANVIGLARQVIFFLPVMYFLPRYIGISGIYYGATAVDLLISVWIGFAVWKLFKKFDRMAAEDKAKELQEKAEMTEKKGHHEEILTPEPA